MHQHGGSADALNPSTNMPFPDTLQKESSTIAENLDTTRETSTIPRTTIGKESGEANWMYPSPRMFYNALKRKGFETKPEDIESMVAVHNFLNEGVWEEVKKWEAPHATKVCLGPTLKRFMGRPNDLSPKAWLFHKVWGGDRPFDRHDWTVERCGGREVRYVIDYYSAGKDSEGMPIFSVDIRPALDSPTALLDRLSMAWEAFKTP